MPPAQYAPRQRSTVAHTFIAIGVTIGVFVIFFTLISIISLLLEFLLGQQIENSLAGVVTNHSFLAGHIIAAAIVIPIFYLIASASNARGRPIFLYFRPLKGRHILTALKYFGFYMLPTMAIILLFSWLGMDFRTGLTEGSELILPSEILLAFVSTTLVAPVLEEIVFRGYLFTKLRQRHGFWVSFLISGSIFAFAHIGYSPVALLSVFIAAYFMSRGFEKTRNLWTPIIIHFLHNFLLTVMDYI